MERELNITQNYVPSEKCGGYAMGYLRRNEKYSWKQNNYPGTIVNDWIHPHVFGDLNKQNILTKKEIFDCLVDSVTTYSSLINAMCQKYANKEVEIKSAFKRHGIPCECDIMSAPIGSSVHLNTPKPISWIYVDDTGEISDIEYSFVKEKYFDGTSTSNIDIQQVDSVTAQFIIHDYGHYIIEAKALSTGEKRQLHIVNLPYMPDYQFAEHTNYYGSLHPADEPLTKLGTPTGDYVTCENVTFGIESPIQHRTVVLARKNYYQRTTGNEIRRVDTRYVYGGCDTLIINTGSSVSIPLDPIPVCTYKEYVEDPADTMGEFQDQTIVFTTVSYGYYTAEPIDRYCGWEY